jgi:RNA polymerase sigma-70 factor, ECF subfamily
VSAIAPPGTWLQQPATCGGIDTTSIRERRIKLRLLLGRITGSTPAVRTHNPPPTADFSGESQRDPASQLRHRRPREELNNRSSDDSSDEQLVAEFQRGSSAAFQTLYCRHYCKARTLALSLTRDDNDAREVVQEAFIRVLCKGYRFEGQAAFYTWLYRIVYNLAIDRMRRPYRKRVPIEQAQELLRDLAPLGLPAIEGTDPFEACSTMQTLRRIIDTIQRLPTHHRDVIVMRELYGMSYSEIAGALGCSKGTIMSRLFHARRRLQGLLRSLREELADATSLSRAARSIHSPLLPRAARD